MASFHYQLGTFTKEQYDALEVSLCDADDSTYIARAVELTDGIIHSPTRGVFLLSEEEAAELEKDPQIQFIHKDPERNPDDFPQPPADQLRWDIEHTYRYNEPVKHRNAFYNAQSYPTSPDTTDLRRCGYQLLRTTRDNGTKAKRDIWASDGLTTSANIKKYGTGKDIDIIVVDDGCWSGHIEFINNRPSNESPTDYVGGNVLPGDGICDVLDLVMDSPYYIDPDWFDADASRKETRWDGTIVPTDTAARDWWTTSSQRSAQFQSYGTVAVPSYYTRIRHSGDFKTYSLRGTHGTACASQAYGRTHGWAYNANKWSMAAFDTFSLGLDRIWDLQKIFHQAKPINPKYGTKDPTLSSNSWGYRSVPISYGWTFHRTTYPGVNYSTLAGRQAFVRSIGQAGDANRLKSEFKDSSVTISGKEMIDAGVIMVTSAGNSTQKNTRWDHPDYDNYWHQQSANGHFGDGVPSTMGGYGTYPTVNRPGWPSHVGATFGDPRTWTINVQNNGSSAYTMSGTDRNGSVSGDNPTITINRGDTINFVIAATGHPFQIFQNTNGLYPDRTDKLVPLATNNTAAGLQNGTITWSPNQATASTLTGADFKYICKNHSAMTGIINVQTGNRTNPAILVGALDDQYASGTKERKVNYSDMGNAIDLFAPGDGTLSAYRSTYTSVPRYDDTYLSKNGNTTWSDGQTGSPISSRDAKFGGTSSACPIACGLIATVVEFNRNWTEADIKTWLATLQNQDTTNDFYDDAELTDPNDTSGWYDWERLHGAPARVIYQGGTYGHTTKETTPKEIKLASSISITGSLGLTRK